MKPPFVLTSVSLILLALSSPSRGEIVERIIAMVNGEIITQSEFETRQVAALQAAGVSGARIANYLRDNNAQILQEAVDDILLSQKAEALGMKIRPDYLDEVIAGIKKENNIPSDDVFREQLAAEGLTIDDLKRNIERSIMRRQAVVREVESKITVPEDVIRAEYTRRSSSYSRPEGVHIQEILLSRETPKAEVTRLVQRARGGEDFQALAKAHSTSATRSSGGDLGRVAVDELNTELRKRLQDLEPGGVADPLETPKGWRIVRLVSRHPAETTPYDQVRAELVRSLTEERMKERYAAFVEGLRKEAIIEYKVREVPLQVTVPTSPAPLRDLTVPPTGDEEFITTPQVAPEATRPGGDPPKP